MMECSAIATAAVPNVPLGEVPNGEPMTDSWSHSSVTGMLLHLSTNTRIDVAHAQSATVCHFNHSPKQSHAAAVKHIVHCLSGTTDKGTIMKPEGTLELNCMSDSDFAGFAQC